jgi:lipopolysaccharide assembly outer membrane protein LptD (OstA)
VKLSAYAAVVFGLIIVGPKAPAQDYPAGTVKHLSVATLHGNRPVSVQAINIERGMRYGEVIHLKGNVEIKTPVCLAAGKKGALVCEGAMILRADEADLHEDTGEIEARGNVRVTPLQRESAK